MNPSSASPPDMANASIAVDQSRKPVWNVALIGNPNTGKSTLFNALAGMNARVGNYPGVTVEKKLGRFQAGSQTVQLIDLPGTYSLSPRSADEMVSVQVLLGKQQEVGELDAVICIVDATHLQRNFYLFSQILDLGLPTLLVLNMWDEAEQQGLKIDVAELRKRLGIPVIPCTARRRQGLEEIKTELQTLLQNPDGRPDRPDLELFPEVFQQVQQELTHEIEARTGQQLPRYLAERLLLDIHGETEREVLRGHQGIAELLRSKRAYLSENGCPIPAIEPRVRYGWAKKQLQGVVTAPENRPVSKIDAVDRWLTHRFSGPVIFAAIMLLMFQAIYTWAGPLMEAIESVQGMAAELVTGSIPAGALRSLLVDGLIAGVGSVVVFLPQIAILFLFIAILEDCGYMARAAYIMDRLMTKVGLSGKSFVPLMSSYACAIPGIMATRTIEDRSERLTTILIAPLMSCSARLPVYLLLINAFIPDDMLFGWLSLRAVVLFGFYLLGAVMAIPVAWLLKKVWFRGEAAPFVMELPNFKWPSLKVVFFRVWDRAKAFLTQAGTLIFLTTVLVWAAGYFPGDKTELNQIEQKEAEHAVAITALKAHQAEELAPLLENQEQAVTTFAAELTALQERHQETREALEEQQSEELAPLQERSQELSAELLNSSYLGRAGHLIEPVVRPLGWDWRLGVGVLASFPAREVVIATLGTIFSLGGDVDEEDPNLMARLQSAQHPDGRPLFNIPVALSVMVFFALCAQCGATLMVMKRETNSWRWPLFAFVYMTLLAYIGAFLVYRIGMLFVGQ